MYVRAREATRERFEVEGEARDRLDNDVCTIEAIRKRKMRCEREAKERCREAREGCRQGYDDQRGMPARMATTSEGCRQGEDDDVREARRNMNDRERRWA